jgi:hypothetical protein
MIPRFYPILEAQGLPSTNHDELGENLIIFSAARIALKRIRFTWIPVAVRSFVSRGRHVAPRVSAERNGFYQSSALSRAPVICLWFPVLAGRW